MTQLRGNPSRRALAQIARPLQEAVDQALGQVLASLTYAALLWDPGSPALMAGDPAEVHDLAFFEPRTELRRRTAWQVPVEAREVDIGWRLSGSLLCLDLAMGHLSLPRLPQDSMPQAPTLSAVERQTFVDSALALTAFDLTDATRRALVDAVERGRSRLLSLDSQAGMERFSADAGLDEGRAQALAWTIAHEPGQRLQLVSLAELARAGGLDASAAVGLDAWGTSGFARWGALSLSYPVHLPWTTMAGRHGLRSATASLVPDLVIGLAERSEQAGLPAPLVAGLVLVATQEFIDAARVAHADDWPAMVAWAQALARDRLDDYVAALTLAGPLVPHVK